MGCPIQTYPYPAYLKCVGNTWIPQSAATATGSQDASINCLDFTPASMSVTRTMVADRDYVTPNVLEYANVTAPAGYELQLSIVTDTVTANHTCSLYTMTGNIVSNVGDKAIKVQIPTSDTATVNTVKFAFACSEPDIGVRIKAVLVKDAAMSSSLTGETTDMYTVLSYAFDVADVVLVDLSYSDISNVSGANKNHFDAQFGVRSSPTLELIQANQPDSARKLVFTTDDVTLDLSYICKYVSVAVNVRLSDGTLGEGVKCFGTDSSKVIEVAASGTYEEIPFDCSYNFNSTTPGQFQTQNITITAKCVDSAGVENPSTRILVPAASVLFAPVACSISDLNLKSFQRFDGPLVDLTSTQYELLPVGNSTSVSLRCDSSQDLSNYGSTIASCSPPGKWVPETLYCAQAAAASTAGDCQTSFEDIYTKFTISASAYQFTSGAIAPSDVSISSGVYAHTYECATGYSLPAGKSGELIVSCLNDGSGSATFFTNTNPADYTCTKNCLTPTPNALYQFLHYDATNVLTSGLVDPAAIVPSYLTGTRARPICQFNDGLLTSSGAVYDDLSEIECNEDGDWIYVRDGSKTAGTVVGSSDFACAANVCSLNDDGSITTSLESNPTNKVTFMPEARPTAVIAGTTLNQLSCNATHEFVTAGVVCTSGGSWDSPGPTGTGCMPKKCKIPLLASDLTWFDPEFFPKHLLGTEVPLGTNIFAECKSSERPTSGWECVLDSTYNSPVLREFGDVVADKCADSAPADSCLITPAVHFLNYFAKDNELPTDILYWTASFNANPLWSVNGFPPLDPTASNVRMYYPYDEVVTQDIPSNSFQYLVLDNTTVPFKCPAGTAAAIITGADLPVFVDQDVPSVKCVGGDFKYLGLVAKSLQCLPIMCPPLKDVFGRSTNVEPYNTWDFAAAVMNFSHPIGNHITPACKSGYVPRSAPLRCVLKKTDDVAPYVPQWDLDDADLDSVCAVNRCYIRDSYLAVQADDNDFRLTVANPTTNIVLNDIATTDSYYATRGDIVKFDGVVLSNTDITVRCVAPFHYPTFLTLTCINKGDGLRVKNSDDDPAILPACSMKCAAPELPQSESSASAVQVQWANGLGVPMPGFNPTAASVATGADEVPASFTLTCPDNYQLVNTAGAALPSFTASCKDVSGYNWVDSASDPFVAADWSCQPLTCPVITTVPAFVNATNSANANLTASVYLVRQGANNVDTASQARSHGAVYAYTCGDNRVLKVNSGDKFKTILFKCNIDTIAKKAEWVDMNDNSIASVSQCYYTSCALPTATELVTITGYANARLDMAQLLDVNPDRIDLKCAANTAFPIRLSESVEPFIECDPSTGKYSMGKTSAPANCVPVSCPAPPTGYTAPNNYIGSTASQPACAAGNIRVHGTYLTCETNYDKMTGILSSDGIWVKRAVGTDAIEPFDGAVENTVSDCVPTSCAIPSLGASGSVVPVVSYNKSTDGATQVTGNSTGLVADIVCSYGYKLAAGVPATVECRHGAWSYPDIASASAPSTICLPVVQCPLTLPAANNIKLNIVNAARPPLVGDIFAVSCATGNIREDSYMIDGEDLVQCSPTGDWTPAYNYTKIMVNANSTAHRSLPKCALRPCLAYRTARTPDDRNHTVLFTSDPLTNSPQYYPSGTSGTIVCDQGFVHANPANQDVTCAAGVWSSGSVCIPKLQVTEASLIADANNAMVIEIPFKGATARVSFSRAVRSYSNGAVVREDYSDNVASDFQCKSVFPAANYQFGDRATCAFSPEKITINLADGFRLRGRAIAIEASLIHSAEVAEVTLGSGLKYVDITDKTNLLAAVVSTTEATTCAAFTIDASASTGANGAPLAYSFELVSGTDDQKAAFAAVVAREAGVKSYHMANVDSDQMIPKVSFTADEVRAIFSTSISNEVRVTVRNWVRNTASSIISFNLADSNVPSIRVSSNTASIFSSQPLVLSATAASSPCAASGSKVAIQWSRNGNVVGTGANFNLPAFSLAAGTYTFTATAIQQGSFPASHDVSQTVVVTVLNSAPVVVVNGQACSSTAGCTAAVFASSPSDILTLDASKSYDPANLPAGSTGMTFRWVCFATVGGVTSRCSDINVDGSYSGVAAQLSVHRDDLMALGANAVVSFGIVATKNGESTSRNVVVDLTTASAAQFAINGVTVSGFGTMTSAGRLAYVNLVTAPVQIVANVGLAADITSTSVWSCPNLLDADVADVSALVISPQTLAAAIVNADSFICTGEFSFLDVSGTNVGTASVSVDLIINKAPAAPVCSSEFAAETQEYKITCTSDESPLVYVFKQAVRGAMTTVATTSTGVYYALLARGTHQFTVTVSDIYGEVAETTFTVVSTVGAGAASMERLAEAAHSQDAAGLTQSITAIASDLDDSTDVANATSIRATLLNTLADNIPMLNDFDALSYPGIQGSTTALSVLATIAHGTQSNAELREQIITLAKSLAAAVADSTGLTVSAATSLMEIIDDTIVASAANGDAHENLSVFKAFAALARYIASATSANTNSHSASVASVSVTVSSPAAAASKFSTGAITVSRDFFDGLTARGITQVKAITTTIAHQGFAASIGVANDAGSSSEISGLEFVTVDGEQIDTSSISEVVVTLKHEAKLVGVISNDVACRFFNEDATEDVTKVSITSSWSQAGCALRSSSATETVCVCSHLTTFAAMAGVAPAAVAEPVDWLTLSRSSLDANRTPIFMIVVWIGVLIVFTVIAYFVDRSKKADAAKALVEQWTAGKSPIVAPLPNDASTCDYIFKRTGMVLADYHLLYSVFARNMLDNVSSVPRMWGALTVYLTGFALTAMFWGGVDARTDIDNYGGVMFLAAVVMVFVSFLFKTLLNSTHQAGVKKFVYRYAFELVALHELGTSDFFAKEDQASLKASLNPAHSELYRQILQAKASGQVLEMNSLLRQVIVLQEEHVLATLSAKGTESNAAAFAAYFVLLAWAVGMCVLICAFGIQLGQTVSTTPGKWIGSAFAAIGVEVFAVKPFIFFVTSIFGVCCASSRAESLGDDKRDRALTAYALDANVIAAMGKAAATNNGYSAAAHSEDAVAVAETDDI